MSWRRIFKSFTFYILLLFVIIAVVNNFSAQDTQKQQLSYSQFLQDVQNHQVKSLVITQDNNVSQITGSLKDGTQFQTQGPADDKTLRNLLTSKDYQDISYQYQKPPQPPWWTTLLSSLLPVVLVIGAFLFIMNQTQSGGNRVMQFGKSRAKLAEEDDKDKITFDAVAGLDEEKEELAEIVDFLKHPQKYIELGARIPKGILLFGPPGTGKTLMARAVAGEAGVPFFSISGSDFVEMFVGVGASRVRDLFEKAKKNAPCIVFVDEIDAVGRQRGAGYGGGHDEREQTLNQLLVEMDGFGVNEGVIVIAATNRPDVLDPALLRPGRFDRQITIGRPDVKARQEILEVHAKGKPLERNVDLEVIAKQTHGFTGADLENLLNEAALLTARRAKRRIGMTEIEQSIDRVITGGPEKRSRVISDHELDIVAYHEAGHALVAIYNPDVDPVHKITIVPRGGAGGYTRILPAEDRQFISKTDLLAQVTWALGGRAAEELTFGDVTTGANNDLERATSIVRKMVTEYGMSENLGPLTFGEGSDNPFLGRDIARGRNYSEEVAAAIDKEISRIVTEAYTNASQVLEDHRDKLRLLASELREHETLEADQIRELLDLDKDNKAVVSIGSGEDEQAAAGEAGEDDQASDDPGQDSQANGSTKPTGPAASSGDGTQENL